MEKSGLGSSNAFVCAVISTSFAERIKYEAQIRLLLKYTCRKIAWQREVWNINYVEEWIGTIVTIHYMVCLGSVWWRWISTKIPGSELQLSFEGVCQDPECPVFCEGSWAFCAPDVWWCVMELRSACMNRAFLFKHSYSELPVPWRFFLPSLHQPSDDEAVAWGHTCAVRTSCWGFVYTHC